MSKYFLAVILLLGLVLTSNILTTLVSAESLVQSNVEKRFEQMERLLKLINRVGSIEKQAEYLQKFKVLAQKNAMDEPWLDKDIVEAKDIYDEGMVKLLQGIDIAILAHQQGNYNAFKNLVEQISKLADTFHKKLNIE